jgi:hypothetical protein
MLDKTLNSENKIPEQSEPKQETEKPKPPPDETRKGRYWNYEHDRWSYCSGKKLIFVWMCQY